MTGDAFSMRSQTDRKEPPHFYGAAGLVPVAVFVLVGRVLGMERSRIEHALSKAVVDALPVPSDLALGAIVAGVLVEDTRPTSADVDIVWPADPTFL